MQEWDKLLLEAEKTFVGKFVKMHFLSFPNYFKIRKQIDNWGILRR